ncbi:bacterioferritin-associated ferredoxin [Streptomyces sp. NPDC087270]|uniref:(2Fe-2S)-binding protein n=1 Tax=Streptomyces sp. NPDC087270 TaxID=3365774 RepID=UPI003803DE20
MYVCSCFGITEQQVKQHAEEGRRTPRQIASACKAGTDCGSCVKRIQAVLGRGDGCATRTRLEPARAPVEPATAPREPVTAPLEPSVLPQPGSVPPALPLPLRRVA